MFVHEMEQLLNVESNDRPAQTFVPPFQGLGFGVSRGLPQGVALG